MKKSHYNMLLQEELKWLSNDWECYSEFWLNEFTHIVISKKPNGWYQILRSFMIGDRPAVSIDNANVKLDDVVAYLIRRILDNQTHKFELEDD